MMGRICPLFKPLYYRNRKIIVNLMRISVCSQYHYVPYHT
jgi:hypothetical protein